MTNHLRAKPWRILHIDDDEDDRFLVRSMLGEARGQTVTLDGAGSYEEGFRKLAENHYQAVLVDYDLGARTGIELIRKFVGDGYDVPMILLTGRGSYEVDVEAMRAGATLYLTKNEVNPLLLERSIRYAIERKQAEAELRKSRDAILERDRKLSVALDAAQLGTWMYNFSDHTLEMDERAQQMYRAGQPKESHDRIVAMYLHPADVPVMWAALEKASDPNGDGRYQTEYRIVQPDGGVCWLNAWGQVEFEGDGASRRAVRLIGASRDITWEKESRETLKESEARFRDLANNISQLAWMADKTGYIFWYNQRWFDYTGLAPEEMEGHGWQKVHHPDYVDAATEKFFQAVASGEPWEDTFPLRGNDGHYRWFLSRAVPIKDEHGNVQRWFGTNTDITEQIQLEEENRQHKDLLERLVQAAPAAIAFLKGPQHVYDLINREYQAIARGKGELIGYTVAEKWPEVADVIVPQLNAVYQSGEPFSVVNAPLLIDRDGLLEEDYFTYTFTPIYRSDGSIEGVMILAMETTTAQRDRLTAEAQSARLEAVLQSLPVGVWIADDQGRMVAKNQQADRVWAGEAPLSEDVQGYSIYKGWWPGSKEVVLPEEWPLVRSIQYGEQEFGKEVNIERFDGTAGTILVSASPIVDRNGSVQGGVAVALDITERKQAIEALEVERAKLAAVIDQLPIGIGISDLQGNTLSMNSAGLKLHGFASEAEMLSSMEKYTGTFDLRAPDGQILPVEEWPFSLAMRGVFVKDYDVRLCHRPTGSERPVSYSVLPVRNSRGETILIVYLIQDLTERRRVMEDLERNRAQLQAVLNNLAEGVIIVDFQGKVVDLNPAGLDLLGYATPEEARKRLPEYQEHFEIFNLNGEVIPFEAWPISRLVRGEAFLGLEARVLCKTSGREWIGSFHGKPIPGPDAVTTLGILTMRDITQQKWSEEALKASEERYRLAARATNDAIWDWDLRTDSLQWNEALTELFGYPASDQKDSSGQWWKDHIHPEDRASVTANIEAVIYGGKEIWTTEYRFLRADGSYAEIFDRGWVARDETGRPVRMVGAMHDITSQTEAQAALRESEARFRQLADSMPQLVWTARPDGTVDYYNQRSRLYSGFKVAPDGHWEWQPVLHPEDIPATAAAWQEALEKKTTYQCEHRALMVDGSYRWHLSRGIPALDEEGQLVKWYGTATDIHDLKQAQAELAEYAEKLKRSNEELENFAFVASHDLQEPLRKIKLFGEGLRRRLDDQIPEEAEDYIRRMQSAADRMQAMINGLLDLSRVSTRGKTFTSVDLGRVVEDVLSDLEARIRSTQGQVIVEPLPAVLGDALQLQQLLQNLIGNALKFHRAGVPPAVRVSGAKVKTGDRWMVKLEISDNGIGFEAAHQDEIFQPFVRLQGRSAYEGNGIGLAICRKIVERHGGAITARSQEGYGSTFTVMLPDACEEGQ